MARFAVSRELGRRMIRIGCLIISSRMTSVAKIGCIDIVAGVAGKTVNAGMGSLKRVNCIMLRK